MEAEPAIQELILFSYLKKYHCIKMGKSQVFKNSVFEKTQKKMYDLYYVLFN